MASLLHYAVAKRVIQSLNLGKETLTNLASLVRIRDFREDKPQFVIPLNKIASQLKEEKINVDKDLLIKLRGNGLIIPDGIVDVNFHNDTYNPLLCFTVNSSTFMEETLLGTYKYLDDLKNVSPLLKCLPRRKTIVEFSSPNIAKPFHVGHIRSTIIGNYVANLQKYLGNHVTKMNYLGDWGTQYGILTAGIDSFASTTDLDQLTISEILNIYVAANAQAENDELFYIKAKEVFNQMEKGDEELLRRWNKLRLKSLQEFDKSYQRLGISFDEIEGESMYREKALKLMEEIKRKNLATPSDDGSLKIEINSAKYHQVQLPLLKKDGSTLYLTRDIAAAIDRKSRFDFEEMFYVVENGQTEHFSALKQVLEKMGYSWFESLQHVKFGRIRGLSTRKGQVVFLEQLLDEAKILAWKAMINSPNTKVEESEEEEIANILGVSAVVINDLKAKRQNDYQFDWSKVLSLKGDTGIQLQYNHARLASLERRFGNILNTEFDSSLLYETEALRLVTHIAKFDEAILESRLTLQPCVLAQYLFKLCFLIGKANNVLILRENKRTVIEARYFLFHVSKLVLNTGMKILGLKPLDRM